MPGTDLSDAQLATLAAACNFRDIGGSPTQDGRRVRRGRLFRSGEPRRLGEDAVAALDAVGLALVCDMRGDVERQYRPVEYDGYRRARCITPEVVRSNADLWAHLDGPAVTREQMREGMLEVYRRLPVEQAKIVRDMVIGAAEGEVPLLFHCAAGKDRTGFAAAVLLELLGVDEAAIMADYVLTEPWMVAQRERFLRKKVLAPGQSETIWDPLFVCDPEYLMTSLAIVRGHAGGIAGWLGHIGVGADHIAAARTHLTEPG